MMMMIRQVLRLVAVAVAAIAFAATAMAADAPGKLGQMTTFSLTNGLRFVVIADHRLPVVTHMVLYGSGSAADAPGHSGLAHLLEHLTFKSCNASKAASFAETITRLGGRDNAVTNHDTTYYYQRVTADRLAAVMDLEARRMARFEITEAEFAAELQVVKQERRANVDGDPIKLLNEEMMAAFYPKHGYGVPPLGWHPEIDTLTLAQAKQYFAANYRPDNAIVVVAGDVTPDQVRKLADATYAAVPSASGAFTPPPGVAAPEKALRLSRADERTARPALFRYYATRAMRRRPPGRRKVSKCWRVSSAAARRAGWRLRLLATTRLRAPRAPHISAACGMPAASRSLRSQRKISTLSKPRSTRWWRKLPALV
jgi:zinc protease